MYNPIELTNDTYDTYKTHLENGSYADGTYATNGDRMVTLINPSENSNYRYYLRSTSGAYYSETADVDDALRFLMTGEYINCFA